MAQWDRKIRRWSLSAYKQWAKCPAQYAYQRFDKLPTPPVMALERGIKIHSLGEAYLKADIAGVPKEYKKFEKLLKAIKRHGFVAEANWAITQDFKPCDWDDWGNNWCLGKTDAHKYSKKERHLDIIDFKTGRIYPDHEDGAEVYSVLGSCYYPDVETFNVEFWYLDQGEGEVGESPFEYDRKAVDEFRDKWERKAHRMLQAKSFRPRPTQFGCKFCPFRSDKALANDDPGPCEAWQDL